MNPLTVAASIAAQIAYVIGARRATRNRRNRAHQSVTVGTFTIHNDTDLARALRGERGPIAQKAALMFVQDQAAYLNHRAAS